MLPAIQYHLKANEPNAFDIAVITMVIKKGACKLPPLLPILNRPLPSNTCKLSYLIVPEAHFLILTEHLFVSPM